MASSNPAVAEAAGQRDELSESLAELFSNVSVMVRGELQMLAEFNMSGVSICCAPIGATLGLNLSLQTSRSPVANGINKHGSIFLPSILLDTDQKNDTSWVGTNNQLALLEKMNDRVAQEYSNYGDVAAGLRVFVEQLNEKNRGFEEYVSQIDAIDQQVTEFEAVVSMLDRHVALLEKKRPLTLGGGTGHKRGPVVRG
ncbi:hypothetical protein C2845_PM12G05350 [Panicum miliaceum]|uniref:Biogenesis of lysosome-related organelles complex 1 subunit 2 n=1 Tax=Panicum miliaceum TaxID=4540 RepID=A0A3L6QJT1_PANMI|nr:hypothetical protein C2845_PM12G05350 [Panicum miliaceum]